MTAHVTFWLVLFLTVAKKSTPPPAVTVAMPLSVTVTVGGGGAELPPQEMIPLSKAAVRKKRETRLRICYAPETLAQDYKLF